MNKSMSLPVKIAVAVGVILVIAAIAIAAIGNDDGEVADTSSSATESTDGESSNGEQAEGESSEAAGEVPEGESSEAAGEVPEDAVDMTGQDTVEVGILDNWFEPDEIIVSPGTEIVWSNNGRNDHNVFPDEEGAFEPIPTASLGREMSDSRIFDEPGSYPYYCSIHGAPGVGQTGVIIVT